MFPGKIRTCVLLGSMLVIADAVNVFKNYDAKETVGSTKTETAIFTDHRREKRNSGCQLTLQDALESKKEPLIFTDDLQIARPEVDGSKGVIHLEEGKDFHLSCSGPGNKQKISKKPIALIQCKGGHLAVEGKKLKGNTGLLCVKSYAGSLLKITQKECGKGRHTGKIVDIGFKIGNDWRPEIEVCHDIEKMSTLYSSHKLYGHSLSGAIQYSGRTSFTKGNKALFRKITPDKTYGKSSQKSVLDNLLGTGSGEKYITEANFLARGHLAPDADFIFVSEQLMTYYYVNVVPQWQPFNAGNWLTVEKDIRKLAKQVGRTLYVITGAYGILKLPDLKGVEKEIFLDPKTKVIPVPEVMWKIVMNPDTNECIVAVGHNNIYLSSPPTTLCDPVTSRGWRTLPDLRIGFTYYCEYKSFIAAVPYAPSLPCTTMIELKDN